MTAFLYGHTLGFGFVWDDLLYVQGSEAYRSFDLKGMLFALGNGVEYLPVRDLTFAVDFLLWGDSPGGFHFSNVLFYTITVVLVYRVTQGLVRLLRPQAEAALVTRVAFITACIFALHPLHVEPVCFVNNRNALVSGMFFFLALSVYLRYLAHGGRGALWACLAFFILAVFSKATAITLPLVLALIAATNGKGLKTRSLELAVFFLVALLTFVLMRDVAHSSHIINPEHSFELSALSPASRIATALQIPFFYIYKFFVPTGLSVDYTPGFSSSLIGAKAGASFTALLLMVCGAFRFRKRFPEGLFAAGVFLALLLPVMNLFLTNPVVADRYAYLPVYPLAVAVASVLVMALKGKRIVVAGGLLCLVLGLVAFERSKAWQSDEFLWQTTLDASPDSALAIYNLSDNYFKQGRIDLAIRTIDRFSSVNPASIFPENMQARVKLASGDYAGAIHILENALLEKEPAIQAYSYLAAAYDSAGQVDKALFNYTKVLQSEQTGLTERRSAEARVRALRPLFLEKFRDELESIQRGGVNPQQIMNLAIKLDSAGLDEEALELYLLLEREHGANWALSFNIGNIHAKREEAEEAVKYFRLSFQFKPDNPQALNGLGLALTQMKDYAGAERAFLEAIRVAPDYDKAPFNLAAMYFRLGKKEQARHYFEYTADRFPELRKRVDAYLSRI